jgi:hypothetical protein
MNKQYILDEIKRTAVTNGGVPLGTSRFFQETGIKNSDWIGKFWARWGDALREAGFEPNQLQTAYNEDMLIGKLIGLTRELGHFPVLAELNMKSAATIVFHGLLHLRSILVLYDNGQQKFLTTVEAALVSKISSLYVSQSLR